MINILLALRERELTGRGCRLDVAMADNLFTFMYWALGNGQAAGAWPRPGGELVTGGSPRYQIYRTEDGRFLAAAPLEQKFWDNFCDAIALAPEWRDDARDAAGTRVAVARCIAARTSAQWRETLAGKDVCCAVVASVEEALADAHFQARGVFARQLAADGRSIAALPVRSTAPSATGPMHWVIRSWAKATHFLTRRSQSSKAIIPYFLTWTAMMLAKMTSKNRLTLPKSITAAVGPTQYFDVEARNGQIVLTPVRIQRGDAVRAKLAELDLQEQDIADAVAWARRADAAKTTRKK